MHSKSDPLHLLDILPLKRILKSQLYTHLFTWNHNSGNIKKVHLITFKLSNMSGKKKWWQLGPNGHTWEIWPWRLWKLWRSSYMFEIQHRPIFVRCYLVLVIIKALYTHMAITTPGFGPAIHCHFHLRPTVNRPDKTSRNW